MHSMLVIRLNHYPKSELYVNVRLNEKALRGDVNAARWL